MKSIKDIVSNYSEPLDSRVTDFLELVATAVEERETSAYTIIILKLLIPQLVLYYKALDLTQKDDKLRHEDVYNRITKSPEIQVLQKANAQILGLLDKLCLSPLEKAKIKRINKDDDDSANELLANLMA